MSEATEAQDKSQEDYDKFVVEPDNEDVAFFSGHHGSFENLGFGGPASHNGRHGQSITDKDHIANGTLGPEERRRSIIAARRFADLDPPCSQIVRLYTDMGLGNGFTVKVVAKGDDIDSVDTATPQIIIDRFIADSRNNMSSTGQRRNSDRLAVDGSWFIVLQDTGAGEEKTRLRRIDTLAITNLISHPDDPDEILFYERTTKWKDTGREVIRWYRDISLFDENSHDAKNKDGEVVREFPGIQVIKRDEKTGVPERDKGGKIVREPFRTPLKVEFVEHSVVHHVVINTREQMGNTMLLASLIWASQYKKFMGSRISLQRARVEAAWKLKIKGGQSTVLAQKAALKHNLSTSDAQDSNPPAVPGSGWLENEGITRENIDQKTAAADAKIDGGLLLQNLGLGAGIFPPWLGQEAFRLSTATHIEAPMVKRFQAFQKTLRDAYVVILKFVLQNAGIEMENIDIDLDFPPIVNKSRMESAQMLGKFLEKLPEFSGNEELQSYWLTLIGFDKPDLMVKQVKATAPEPEPVPSGDANLSEAADGKARAFISTAAAIRGLVPFIESEEWLEGEDKIGKEETG